MSRHIPAAVNRKISERDQFKCAWCGNRITERHHIEEYHLGGKHTVDNLILLCPICHTMIHKGQISALDLVDRRSLRANVSRSQSRFDFDLNGVDPTFLIGGGEFTSCPIILKCGEQSFLSYKQGDDAELLISCRFYDKSGELIFWMSENYFWTLKNFRVLYEDSALEIKSSDHSFYLKIANIDGKLQVKGRNFYRGVPVNFNTDSIIIGNSSYRFQSMSNCNIAIQIG
uniref:HNH endonuclease n=1 Tax=Sphingobacterium sp. (strain 21) TaxID=743722 RepID=F4C2D6_SPHS2